MKNLFLWKLAGFALAMIMIINAGWAIILLSGPMKPAVALVVLCVMSITIELCIERAFKKN